MAKPERKITDGIALDVLAAWMDGREWGVELLDAIAETLRETGRTVRDSADVFRCFACDGIIETEKGDTLTTDDSGEQYHARCAP